MFKRVTTISCLAFFCCFVIYDGNPVFANETTTSEPILESPMSEDRLTTFLKPNGEEAFQSENWKKFPRQRLRMLPSFLKLLPSLKKQQVWDLLGGDVILGGPPKKVDDFIMSKAIRCGGSPCSILELQYQSNSVCQYRFLYYPEGVDGQAFQASNWFTVSHSQGL
jgi:hypothetical protein